MRRRENHAFSTRHTINNHIEKRTYHEAENSGKKDQGIDWGLGKDIHVHYYAIKRDFWLGTYRMEMVPRKFFTRHATISLKYLRTRLLFFS